MSAIDEDSLKLLNAQIFRETQKYKQKHYMGPKYVKVPEWVLHLMRSSNKHFLNIENTEDKGSKPKDIYMGLIVCPTSSIESIFDIEVF